MTDDLSFLLHMSYICEVSISLQSYQFVTCSRRVHRIHVSGTDIPDPVDTWDKLKERFGVPENLLATITEHYPAPTPIQVKGPRECNLPEQLVFQLK